MTVPLSVEARVSAVELSVGSGSGSFRAAFLAQRLCFANLTLGFLEVLILARRSNKEPSEYSLSWPADETKNHLSPLPLAVCLNSGWLPGYRFHHVDVQDAEPIFVAPDPDSLCCDR